MGGLASDESACGMTRFYKVEDYGKASGGRTSEV